MNKNLSTDVDSSSHVLVNHNVSESGSTINVLKSTFGFLSDSILNKDDDNLVVKHLLDIQDNTNGLDSPCLNHGYIDCTVCKAANTPVEMDDNENIQTLAEEDEVYKPYGFSIGRPRHPNKFRVPRPLCHHSN